MWWDDARFIVSMCGGMMQGLLPVWWDDARFIASMCGGMMQCLPVYEERAWRNG